MPEVESNALAAGHGITLYHHGGCSKSRAALELLRERGIEPHIIEYRKTPLDVPALRALMARLGVPVRAVMRSGEAAYTALNLGDDTLSADALLAAIAAHPELLERPIVTTPQGAAVCRPPERVLGLLGARLA